MDEIALGQTSLRVSRLGYGCWRLGGILENAVVTPEQREKGRRAVTAAYEAGYTFFDHADIYAQGESEAIFGEALRAIPGMRERVTVATKCGIRMADGPPGEAPYRYDSSEEHIVASCEGSLRRMGIETIDLLMLHRPDFLGRPEEVAAAFERLRREGKARYFGASNFSPSRFALYQKTCSVRLEAHQVEISLARWEALEDGTLDQCLAEGVTPLGWSPLAGGRLGSSDPIDLREPDHAHRLQVRETLERAARARGSTAGQVAIAWLLKHPAGIVPLVGATNPDRIRNLTGAADLELTREEWYQLTEAAYGRRLP